MPRASYHPRRAESSPLGHVPHPKMSRGRKELFMALGVGFSMLCVAAMYAASFGKQRIFTESASDLPRWGSVASEYFEGMTRPVSEEFGVVRDRMTGALKTELVRGRSVRLMKEKLAARSASATPEAGRPTPDR